MLPRQVDEDPCAALPCLLPTETAVTDPTARGADPVLQRTTRRQQHTARCQLICHQVSTNTPPGVNLLNTRGQPTHHMVSTNMPPRVNQHTTSSQPTHHQVSINMSPGDNQHTTSSQPTHQQVSINMSPGDNQHPTRCQSTCHHVSTNTPPGVNTQHLLTVFLIILPLLRVLFQTVLLLTVFF